MCLLNMVYPLGTLVVLPRFSPEAVLVLQQREGINIFAGSPTLFISLLSHKMTERFGDNLPPTSRQLECLKRLGEQRGRDYKVPATRKQASDRIRRILESQHTGS